MYYKSKCGIPHGSFAIVHRTFVFLANVVKNPSCFKGKQNFFYEISGKFGKLYKISRVSVHFRLQVYTATCEFCISTFTYVCNFVLIRQSSSKLI